MKMELTEEQISQKLKQALAAAGPASDGYAEIDLIDETRIKCAAGLGPLLRPDDGWPLVFTRRTDKSKSHKGRGSFSGGGGDASESSPEQAAVRGGEGGI